MNDIIIEGLSTVVSLAVGGLIGYVVAYVTGLRAVRKGMQLMLRGCLDGFGQVRTGSDRFGQETILCQELSILTH